MNSNNLVKLFPCYICIIYGMMCNLFENSGYCPYLFTYFYSFVVYTDIICKLESRKTVLVDVVLQLLR